MDCNEILNKPKKAEVFKQNFYLDHGVKEKDPVHLYWLLPGSSRYRSRRKLRNIPIAEFDGELK